MCISLEELIKDPETIPPALIFPVVVIASIYAFCQYREVVPKSCALSDEGTRSESNLPVAVIVSLVALPKSTFPCAIKFAENVLLPENV